MACTGCKNRFMGVVNADRGLKCVECTTYENCNFSQPKPVDLGGGRVEGVDIFKGDTTPRTFINCNLKNCKVPTGSTLEGHCNTALVEEVTIDNVRHARVYGKVDPKTLEAQLLPDPVDHRL